MLSYWICVFQFHNGSIKGLLEAWLRLYIGCFNSTMVRLKATLKKAMKTNPEFQFHNGSIKGTISEFYLSVS